MGKKQKHKRGGNFYETLTLGMNGSCNFYDTLTLQVLEDGVTKWVMKSGSEKKGDERNQCAAENVTAVQASFKMLHSLHGTKNRSTELCLI